MVSQQPSLKMGIEGWKNRDVWYHSDEGGWFLVFVSIVGNIMHIS
jgi:hypothetical protein